MLRHASRKVLTATVGTVLLAAGIVMLVTPGPGLLVIAAGLAVLARDFHWAASLLARLRARVGAGTVTRLDDRRAEAAPGTRTREIA